MNLTDFEKIAETETYLDTGLQAFKLKDKLLFSEQPNIVAVVDDDWANIITFYIADYSNFSENLEKNTTLVSYLFNERALKKSLFDAEEFGQGVSLETFKNCYGNSGLLSCNIEDLLSQPRYISQTTVDENEFIAKVTHQENNVTINLDAVIEDFLNLYYYNSKYIIP